MKYSNSSFSHTATTVKRPVNTNAGRGEASKGSGKRLNGKERLAPPDLLKYQRSEIYPLSSVVSVMTNNATT